MERSSRLQALYLNFSVRLSIFPIHGQYSPNDRKSTRLWLHKVACAMIPAFLGADYSLPMILSS